MKEIIIHKINDQTGYIASSDQPLSADIGIIKQASAVWLYDVGNGESCISGLNENYNIVLSHFHADHTGNIGRIHAGELYVSRETRKHLPKELPLTGRIHIVCTPVRVGNLYIFPIPSSHARGCLGLEINGTLAFMGDALYSKISPGGLSYNVQLLREEIRVLKELHASLLLVSHFPGLIRKKDEVIKELEEIYSRRVPDESEIWISRNG